MKPPTSTFQCVRHFVVILLCVASLQDLYGQYLHCASSIITTRYQLDHDGTSWRISIEAVQFVNGEPDTNNYCFGPIISVSHGGTNCPFSTIDSNSFLTLVLVSAFVPANSFSETYSIIYTNATNVILLANPPEFVVQPAGQSCFVGESTSFTAFAIHTTGWHWQKDGTNLVDSTHYWGVTNSVLTITNVQPSDAGVYAAVASQPGGLDIPSADAVLAVFKPLGLSLKVWPGNGYLIIGTNVDGTPVELERLANLALYTTTNLRLGFDGWEPASNALVLTNGIVEATLSDDGGVARFWRMLESP